MSTLKFLVVVFCTIVLLSPSVQGVAPVVTNSTVKVKDFQLLGADLNIATYTFTFDQDLYLHRSNYCPAYNCTTDSALHNDQNACVCDFASQAACGTGFQFSNSSASCSCDYLTPSPCDTDVYNWTAVTLTSGVSQTLRVTLMEGEIRHFRVFVNSKCQGFRATVNTVYGLSSFYVGNKGVANAQNSHWKMTNSFQKEEVYICPSDEHFIQGTYFIAVLATTDTVFDLVVEDLFIAQPSTPQPENCNGTNPYPWLSTATCIYDGVPKTFSNLNNLALRPPTYTYNITFTDGTCTPVFVALNEYASVYGALSKFRIQFPRDGNATRYSGIERDSFIVCPHNTESWTLMAIKILITNSRANFRLTVTSGHFDYWRHMALASIPTYEFNFEMLGTASVDTYPYPVDISAWNVNTTTGVKTPVTKYAISCTDWKVDCKIMSYATNDNPFFPVPPVVLNLPGVGDLFRTVQGNYSIPVSAPVDSKSFSLVALLSYKTNSLVKNIPEEVLQEISVEFQGRIGNLVGDLVEGNFTASTMIQPSCDNTKFHQSLSSIQERLADLAGADSVVEINTLRYILDSTAFQDGFAFCRSYVDSLTVGKTSQNFTITSFFCPYASDTYDWYEDPCCNQAAVWIGTCFPRNLTGPMPQFGVQTAAVQQVCKNVDCSQSYLEDYASAKATFESGQCSVDLAANTLLKEQYQKQYLVCKKQAFLFADQKCLQDSDCTYYYDNTTYACSLSTGTCLVPYRTMERALVACLDSYLTEGQEVYLATKYGFGNQSTVDGWLNALTSVDCVDAYGSSPNLDHRARVLTVPTDYDCAIAWSCASYECEDHSCPYPDLTCHYTCGITKSFEHSSESECKEDYSCNWNHDLCEGENLTTCTDLCETQPSQSHFCGHCDSFDNCVEFTEISSPSVCASTSVCLLSNGSYYFNLTDNQCDSLQRCDLPYCGRQCTSSSSTYSTGICFSYEANSTACTDNGGQWLNNNITGAKFSNSSNVCVYSASTNTTCATFPGGVWQTCDDLSLYQCSLCSGSSCANITQNLMKCHIVGKPCTDSNTCANSGVCSDSTALLDMTSSTQRYGACVMGRFPPADVTSFPYCLAGQTALPSACMWSAASVPNVAKCSQTQSLTGQCRGRCRLKMRPVAWHQKLALKFFKIKKDIHQKMSPTVPHHTMQTTGQASMNGDLVVGLAVCREGCPGLKDKCTISTNGTSIFQIFEFLTVKSTINYLQLQQDFMESGLQTSAFESKSAALCQYQRTLVPMEAVTCDCADAEASQCFAVDPVLSIAQTQVCTDSGDTEFYAGLRLTFYNDTVSFGCNDVLISKISVRTFASSKEQKLLANFIPLTEKIVPEYPVYNDNGAVVGTILTDGVTLTPLADTIFHEFELCIQLEADQKEYTTSVEYPKLDFATTDANKDVILPLSFPVHEITVLENSVYDGKYLCGIISNLTEERSYFAIQRKTSYEDVHNDNLSPTASAISYTLAVMFLVTAVISSGQIAYYIFSFVFSEHPLVLEHFLILFIWIFVTVRTVYFFLVIGGLDSQVADYILVALPTFFYFTAFSIIVVLWAVVVSKRFTSDVAAFRKTTNKSLIGVNVVLYATFIALVLAFQFAKSTSESPCSGRQDGEDNSSQLKRNISIIYGMIIAGISLIIGVLFVVFGIRIRNVISMSQSTEKVFIVTSICSVCFILHSAFIVVVSFLSTPNLYFSFVGLVVTEWFPALFIISWLFVQRASSISSARSKTSGTGNRISIRNPTTTQSRTGGSYASKTDTSCRVELAHLEVGVDSH